MVKTPIICLGNTLKIARWYAIFPEQGREFKPGMYFYCKLLIMASVGSVVLIGSFLHLVTSISASIYTSLDSDLIYTLSLGSTYFFTFAFLYNRAALAELFMFLSDFAEFGKPIEFDGQNRFYNKFSKYYYTILEIMVTGIVTFSTYYNFEDCEKLNLKYDLDEICGLLSYTWMPFDIDYFPVKQIFLVIQLLGAHYLYMVAGICGSGITFETVQHIRIRIRHVNYLLRDAVTEENPEKCREKFNFAVRYHSSLFSLEDKLNGAFGLCMFTHLVITAAILGTGVFAILTGGSFGAFMVSLCWFSGLGISCIAGQWLQDECFAVGTDLYETEWTHCAGDIKRDIMMVIWRSWTPMYLRAGPFGVMDYRMFLGVVKASYSYITLLTQTR